MTSFSFNSTALSTFGQVTLIDDAMDIPERRGQDVLIPYAHGRRFVEKRYDSRKMTFGIAIKGTDRTDFESKLDTLKTLISGRTQQYLKMTMNDSSIRQVYAAVERNIQIRSESPIFARVVIEFSLAFPFFRLSTAIADNTTTIDSASKNMVVTNPGTVEERSPTIILTGPLQNTTITNLQNDSSLNYSAAITAPDYIRIQFNEQTGIVSCIDSGSVNQIANLTYGPYNTPLIIEPGSYALTITDDTHTTGTVRITFNAPYL
jgi:phage-related protein